MAVENPFDQKIGYKFALDIDGDIVPLKDNVIVKDMSFEGRTLNSGIILLGDDGKTDGIRPRWAKVYAVGPEQQDVKVDQWVLVEHGRWSRGVKINQHGEEFIIRRADPKSIIFVSDIEPIDKDDIISSAVHAERKSREQYE
jgi:co-chaperonin GroES (HSP10)